MKKLFLLSFLLFAGLKASESLYIAIPVEDAALRSLQGDIQSELASKNIAFTPERSLHITLIFTGTNNPGSVKAAFGKLLDDYLKQENFANQFNIPLKLKSPYIISKQKGALVVEWNSDYLNQLSDKIRKFLSDKGAMPTSVLPFLAHTTLGKVALNTDVNLTDLTIPDVSVLVDKIQLFNYGRVIDTINLKAAPVVPIPAKPAPVIDEPAGPAEILDPVEKVIRQCFSKK